MPGSACRCRVGQLHRTAPAGRGRESPGLPWAQGGSGPCALTPTRLVPPPRKRPGADLGQALQPQSRKSHLLSSFAESGLVHQPKYLIFTGSELSKRHLAGE